MSTKPTEEVLEDCCCIASACSSVGSTPC